MLRFPLIAEQLRSLSIIMHASYGSDVCVTRASLAAHRCTTYLPWKPWWYRFTTSLPCLDEENVDRRSGQLSLHHAVTPLPAMDAADNAHLQPCGFTEHLFVAELAFGRMMELVHGECF